MINTGTFARIPYDKEEFDKYASFTWVVESTNPDENAIFEMRTCEKQDFMGLDKDYAYYSNYEPKSLLCPENLDKLRLMNGLESPANNTMVNLMVTSCVGPHCETNVKKIRQFFGSLYFEMYFIKDSLDYSKQKLVDGKPPIRKVM